MNIRSLGIRIPDAGSYVLYKKNTTATSWLPGENDETTTPGKVPQEHRLPPGITVTAGTGSTYNFDDWGSPETPHER